MCTHIYTYICFGAYLFKVTKVSILPPTPQKIFFHGRMVKFVNDALHVEHILSLALETGQQ